MKTVFDLPSIPFENNVQFYYLEASFPSNAPQSIVSTAGSAFNDYSTTHAGLGVWNVDDNIKFSIDFVAYNYTGALFPDTSNGIEGFAWMNGATVQVTNPLVEDDWVNSRLIVATSGVAYQDFVSYLQSNLDSFSVYQPVTVTYATQQQLSNYTNNNNQPFNSYTAVDIWVNQLASFGCSVQAFLQVYSTAFYYLSSKDYSSSSSVYEVKRGLAAENSATDYLRRNNGLVKRSMIGLSERNSQFTSNYLDKWETLSDDLINIPNDIVPIPVVSWTNTVNQDVYEWYRSLQDCFDEAYQAVISIDGGAEQFEDLARECYGSYAYVYLSETSVYNVSLLTQNDSIDSYGTPLLGRYIYDLPSVNLDTGRELSDIDYAVSALLLLAIVSGIVYLMRKFFVKKQRRRVSFMGEQVAAQAVKTLHEEELYSKNTYDYFYNPSRHDRNFSKDGYNLSYSNRIMLWMRGLIQWNQLASESPIHGIHRNPSQGRDISSGRGGHDLETPLTLHTDAIRKSITSHDVYPKQQNQSFASSSINHGDVEVARSISTSQEMSQTNQNSEKEDQGLSYNPLLINNGSIQTSSQIDIE